MFENKVIVMVRLSDGSDKKVSCKCVDRPLGMKEHEELKSRISREIVPCVDEALYYTVRATISGKKRNWRVDKLSELSNVVSEIFGEV